MAIEGGDFDGALHHLDNAKLALLRLGNGGNPHEDLSFTILGLVFHTPPPKDLMDPTLSAGAGYGLLLDQLYEELQWDIGNGALLTATQAVPISPAQFFGRWKARIAFVEFMLHRRAPDADAHSRITWLDAVLAHDPNHADARLYKAFELWDLRRYEAAHDLLDPEAVRHDPMLLADGARRDMWARVVTDQFLDAPSGAHRTIATAAFARVHREHGDYAWTEEPVLTAASHLFAGLEAKDAARLRATRDTLLRWETADVRDQESVRKLVLALDAAANQIDATEPTR